MGLLEAPAIAAVETVEPDVPAIVANISAVKSNVSAIVADLHAVMTDFSAIAQGCLSLRSNGGEEEARSQ